MCFPWILAQIKIKYFINTHLILRINKINFINLLFIKKKKIVNICVYLCNIMTVRQFVFLLYFLVLRCYIDRRITSIKGCTRQTLCDS